MSAPSYSDDELARAWIRRFSQDRTRVLLVDSADSQARDGQRIDTETKWAFDELERLVAEDPPHAWAVILCLLNLANDDETALANLAAGPLETLLARHGRMLIERVETAAKSNPQFRELLGGIWRNAIEEPVWERIQALAGSSTSPKTK